MNLKNVEQAFQKNTNTARLCVRGAVHVDDNGMAMAESMAVGGEVREEVS